MKKFIAVLLSTILLLTIVGCGDSPQEPEEAAQEEPAEEEVVEEVEEPEEVEEEPEEEIEEPVELTREEEIEKIIRDRAEEKYKNLEIDSVLFIENEEDENLQDIIVNSRFTIANRVKTADDVILMYGPDMPANFYQEDGAEGISDFIVYIKDEHNNRQLSFFFEKTDNGFKMFDKMGFEDV